MVRKQTFILTRTQETGSAPYRTVVYVRVGNSCCATILFDDEQGSLNHENTPLC